MLWTHYDCEVSVWLFATQDECYQQLKNNWLDDCDEECGHNPDEEMSNSEISEAVGWHYDELSWDICPTEVPEEEFTVPAPVAEAPPAPVSITAAQAGDLLSRLQSFQERS